MWRAIKRLFLYPLSLLLIVLAYIGAGLLAARLIDSIWMIAAIAALAAYAVGYWCIRAIERQSKHSNRLAMVASAILAAFISLFMWRYAGQPGVAPEDSGIAHEASSYWTLSDGARISFMHCGAPEGEHARPLIFLHGGPAIPPRSSTSRTICAIAERGYSVYAYDQIGSGASTTLADISGYSVKRHVADLEEIRELLGAKQIDLIGVSWGTVLASHYIAAHPGRVVHAVFVSPGILGPRNGDDVKYDYSPTASADYDGVLLPPLRVIVAGALARINPRAAVDLMAQSEAGIVMDELAADPGMEYQGKCKGAKIDVSDKSRGRGANYYANLMTAQDLKRATNPLAAIRRSSPPPVLILRGECDYIPRLALGRYEAAFEKVRVIEVKGEGHSFLGARPDIVVPETVCFLSDQSADYCAAQSAP
ncbi:MAG: alpha/beta fold hydrolase [Steroidobacteraceae bacterium]